MDIPAGEPRTPLRIPRCPSCLIEQFATTVPAFSAGEQPCVGCGRVPRVFYELSDYHQALRTTWEQQSGRRR